MNWRDDEPTEKQISAINNLYTALEVENKLIPETKGKCSDLINDLIKKLNSLINLKKNNKEVYDFWNASLFWIEHKKI